VPLDGGGSRLLVVNELDLAEEGSGKQQQTQQVAHARDGSKRVIGCPLQETLRCDNVWPPDVADTRGDERDTNRDAFNTRGDAFDTRRAALDTRGDALDTLRDAFDTRGDALDTLRDAFDTRGDACDT
jgi:hypothetical protein